MKFDSLGGSFFKKIELEVEWPLNMQILYPGEELGFRRIKLEDSVWQRGAH